ncbi:5-methyltetrahydropteroyltriglutamate--homocysteine methyltransferase, partial [Clarias magur]
MVVKDEMQLAVATSPRTLLVSVPEFPDPVLAPGFRRVSVENFHRLFWLSFVLAMHHVVLSCGHPAAVRPPRLPSDVLLPQPGA